jgi:dipeptidyl aminopeptidase/acylaminoacyl peptidase
MRRIFVLVIVGIVLFGFSVQSVNAQDVNIAEEIIGTWINQVDGVVWVFNANGTVTVGSDEYKYGVTDTKMAVKQINSSYFMIFDISISRDGKMIIFCEPKSGTWLIKVK